MQSVPSASPAQFLWIPLSEIRPSRTNPRGKLEKASLDELTASVAKQGVLMPVLVRPVDMGPEKYELVAGHRRHAAARAAALESIPATVRELSDIEALEIQVVENLQRSDLSPLEEAEGYQRLVKTAKYDAARIAERVGRSVKYVYDRMKLLSLTEDAKALLIEEKITAGHAILLARLSGKEQGRAMKEHALFVGETTLFDPEETGGHKRELKAVSVREFAGWVDKNVRFDLESVDPVLFPATADALKAADDRAFQMGSEPKVIAITYENYVAETARSAKEKTFGPRSWKRADGERSSKKCEHSVLGFVAAGVHRGDAFAVCIAKEKCKTHWAAAMREKKKRAAEREETSASAPAANKSGLAKPEPKVDKKLAIAIQNAADAARTEAQRECEMAAAKLSPEAFIRMVAATQWNDLQPALVEAGEKVRGEKAIVGWCQSTPLPQVQRVFVAAMIDVLDLGIYTKHFAVDEVAIEKRLVDETKQAHAAAQTSAPAKGKPAKASKPSKSKPAAADDDMGDDE